MRIAYYLITICGIGILLSLLFGALAPSCLWIMAILIPLGGLACASIVTLILGLARWRKESRWWMGPTMLCVAFWLLIVICTRAGVWVALGDWRFKHQLAAYVSIVDSLRAGTVPCSHELSDVSVTNLPPHTIHMRAACCADGGLLVMFLDKGSSAVGHGGYVFKDYAETSNCAAEFTREERIWRLRHITGNWYRLTD